MTFDKILKDLRNGRYEVERPQISKLREDHVFNEDLSVKKNREMVKEHNEKAAKLWREYIANNGIARERLENDIIDAIVTFSEKINIEQAKIIYYYSYREHHSGGYHDIITNLYDLIEFVEKILYKLG